MLNIKFIPSDRILGQWMKVDINTPDEVVKPPSQSFLRWTTKWWFAVTTLGLWIFMTHVLVTFIMPALHQDYRSMASYLSVYREGQWGHNAVVLSHLISAVIALMLGPMQWIPAIRSQFPAVHRMIGKIFILSVLIAVLSGLYLLFIEDIGSEYLKVGFLIQAILIFWFGGMTVKFAAQKQFESHYRWPLRFFIVANIALFYRIILMVWVMLTGGG